MLQLSFPRTDQTNKCFSQRICIRGVSVSKKTYTKTFCKTSQYFQHSAVKNFSKAHYPYISKKFQAVLNEIPFILLVIIMITAILGCHWNKGIKVSG